MKQMLKARPSKKQKAWLSHTIIHTHKDMIIDCELMRFTQDGGVAVTNSFHNKLSRNSKKRTPATETTIQVMSLWNEITWNWLSGGWPRARDYRKTRSFRWLDLKVSCTHGDQTQHPEGRRGCFYPVLHAVTGMIYRILEYFSLKVAIRSLGWFISNALTW